MATSTQWQLAHDAAERYEQILVPAILGPAARSLVEWSDLRTGEAVVDIGCGTGAATRIAAECVGPSGHTAGVDVNSAMLEVGKSAARGLGARVEWFENSAYQLPFSDAEFDVALSAQTLQFLDDRPRALAEMRRVLRPGGRVAVSLWCEIRESPYFHALVQAVTTHVGTETASGLESAFALGDSEAIGTLLRDAGLRDVDATVKQLDLPLPRPGDFVPRHVSATPMAAGFSAASEEARSAVIDDVTEQLRQYETDSGVRVPFRMHLATGTR